MQYSPSTKTFYASDLDYPNLPKDVIEVAQSDFELAIATRAEGGTFDFKNGVLELQTLKTTGNKSVG